MHVVNPRTGDNDRAHDLVDLQILEHDEPFDLAKIRSTATRLFAARGTTRWPPTVIAYENWETIYAEAANGLAVLATVDEAVRWANGLVWAHRRSRRTGSAARLTDWRSAGRP